MEAVPSVTAGGDPYSAYYNSTQFQSSENNFSRTALHGNDQGQEQIKQSISESDPDSVPYIIV